MTRWSTVDDPQESSRGHLIDGSISAGPGHQADLSSGYRGWAQVGELDP